MATINGNEVKVSYKHANGYKVKGLEHHSLDEVREAISMAKKCLQAVYDYNYNKVG